LHSHLISYWVKEMGVYKIPNLLDINAKSRLIRNKQKLLIIGRCIEVEHPDKLRSFAEDYAIVSVCLEREHMNMVGYKLAGIIARNDFEEIAVLSVDGSPHCVQLHYMLEETAKVVKKKFKRKHFVIEDGGLIKIPENVVKVSRYLSKVHKLMNLKKDESNVK